MIPKIFTSLAVISTMALAAMGQERETPVVLVKDGGALVPIVRGTVAEPVNELKVYLDRISGADFQIVEPSSGLAGLYVGLSSDFPDLNENDVISAEGFRIRTDRHSVYLLGVDPRGVQHAVSTFLQRLGCRWFFPGQAWEVIPAQPTIAGSWNETQVPSFPTKRRIWYG